MVRCVGAGPTTAALLGLYTLLCRMETVLLAGSSATRLLITPLIRVVNGTESVLPLLLQHMQTQQFAVGSFAEADR